VQREDYEESVACGVQDFHALPLPDFRRRVLERAPVRKGGRGQTGAGSWVRAALVLMTERR
jgi:hypothetical protein